ncbi:MAG TPA: hypothetical protein VGI83_01335 [Gemmatimonadales bacterium]
MTTKPIALTRELTPAIIRCELTHVARSAIDLDKARAQHTAYEQALTELGCAVQRLKAAPAMADAVFIEDTAVILDEVAVIARPGAESRRVEVAAVAEALKPHRKLIRLESPATLDGGDVIVAGKTIFVGQTARTNALGREALVRATTPYGYKVEGMTVTKCLHLKSAASLVADDTMLINPKWAWREAFLNYRIVEVDPDEPWAANALRVGDSVIHAAEFPKTRERLEQLGLRVRPVESSELAKAEGGVTCCSLIFTAGKAAR